MLFLCTQVTPGSRVISVYSGTQVTPGSRVISHTVLAAKLVSCRRVDKNWFGIKIRHNKEPETAS